MSLYLRHALKGDRSDKANILYIQVHEKDLQEKQICSHPNKLSSKHGCEKLLSKGPLADTRVESVSQIYTAGQLVSPNI